MTEIEGFVSGLEVDEGIHSINSVLAWTICDHIFFLNCGTLILFSRFFRFLPFADLGSIAAYWVKTSLSWLFSLESWYCLDGQ